jgi:CheY-like chemotaxis protein
MMPVMDGLTFVRELRKRPEHCDIPVVVLTAKDLTADERERLGDTVCRVLQKGACRRDVLLREIGERCAGTPSAAAPAP